MQRQLVIKYIVFYSSTNPVFVKTLEVFICHLDILIWLVPVAYKYLQMA